MEQRRQNRSAAASPFLAFRQDGKVSSAFQRRGLRKAAEALGGEAQLRQFLDVPSADISLWLRDREATVPEQVMRKVVTLLADLEAGIPPQSAPVAGPQDVIR